MKLLLLPQLHHFLIRIDYYGVFAYVYPDSGDHVVASPSPLFNVEIIDSNIDWIDLDNSNFTKRGNRSISSLGGKIILIFLLM
jgi:hypothetical protein